MAMTKLMDATGFSFMERIKLSGAKAIIEEQWRDGTNVIRLLRNNGFGRDVAQRLVHELTELHYLRSEVWTDARYPNLRRVRLVPGPVLAVAWKPGPRADVGGQVLLLPTAPDPASEGPWEPGPGTELGVLFAAKEEGDNGGGDSSTTKGQPQPQQRNHKPATYAERSNRGQVTVCPCRPPRASQQWVHPARQYRQGRARDTERLTASLGASPRHRHLPDHHRRSNRGSSLRRSIPGAGRTLGLLIVATR